VRWQSEFHRSDDGAVARQPAHALLDLVASWQFTPKLGLTAKVENATDRKVLTSLMWPDQSFYAPPRHGSVTLRWTY
jgi:outer membrane receptor for ferric coprogen and ferric-rhodotorulic acid